MKMWQGFSPPEEVIGFDTETCEGSIITQQFWTYRGGEMQFVSTSTVLGRFLRFLSSLYKKTGKPTSFLVFLFNAQFDVPLLFREFIDKFLEDDFEAQKDGWHLKVFCSKNWHCTLTKGDLRVDILDIRAFFSGSLDSVSKTFGIKKTKLARPQGLGYRKYTKKDKSFVAYAMQDAKLCYQMGVEIVKMHAEFDIPMSSSSANLAEKVFRRMFIPQGEKIQFPPQPCVRLSELAYHGGKNGYYLDGPAHISRVFEYDFNAAYGYAMYSLPSFLSGHYKKVEKFVPGLAGVYQVTGEVLPCPYGILYNLDFEYYIVPSRTIVRSFCTSFELEEAVRSKEFRIKECKGYVWKPDTEENPIHEYAKYFWNKKNDTPKGDIRYLFYKLCLNSLYGKWIQRNPQKSKLVFDDKGQGQLSQEKDVAGGLYHPFIGALITGFTRARLHQAEHYFNAVESSTDAVKTREYNKEHDKEKGFGVMQLESKECPKCDKKIKCFSGLFVRNRLNLLMDKAGHILKYALHGFWGKKEELFQMYKHKRVEYSVERMPHIREGLKQEGKDLFRMYSETRRINIDWDELKEE